MQITPIGVGAAFALTLDNTNYLVRPSSGPEFLVDFGHTAPRALARAGVALRDVSHVCLSHLHSDHIGGLEHLGFASRFVNRTRPALYAPAPVFDWLWPHALDAAMGAAGGNATLQSYFETRPLDPGRPARFGSVEALPVAVPHVPGRPSYGYLLSDKETGGRAFLTCDSRFAPELLAACAEEADLVFHDCEWGEPASGVHARIEELLQLPDPLQRKVFLIHYRDDWEKYGGETGAMRLARAGTPHDL